MGHPMMLPPELPEFRFAVYCRSYLLGLTDRADQPVALYRDENLAIAHGQRLWPSTYTVVDLAKDELA